MSEHNLGSHERDLGTFPVTGGPFERPYDARAQEVVRASHTSWDQIKYELGFQESDIQAWLANHYRVLEVGPGIGVSLEQLTRKGVEVYAIEPALRYDTVQGKTEPIELMRQQLQQPHYAGKVSDAYASEAAGAFPGVTFRVAFAIGINFQYYSPSAEALIGNIAGVMGALTDREDSYFTFTTDDTHCDFNIQHHPQSFQLARFLGDYEIAHQFIKFRSHTMREQTAIRIYNGRYPSGEQVAERLQLAVLHEDLSRYL